MNDTQRFLAVMAAILALGLLLLMSACSPCVSAYAVGCAPFPTAAPRS